MFCQNSDITAYKKCQKNYNVAIPRCEIHPSHFIIIIHNDGNYQENQNINKKKGNFRVYFQTLKNTNTYVHMLQYEM